MGSQNFLDTRLGKPPGLGHLIGFEYGAAFGRTKCVRAIENRFANVLRRFRVPNLRGGLVV